MPVTKAGVIEDVAIVRGSVEEVYKYLSDFANTCKWDPGVKSSVRNDPADKPVAVGSSFNLVTVLKGSESQMTYEITELEPPHRIVLKGSSDVVDAIDEIRLSPAEGKDGFTKVDYKADLSLRGLRKPFIIFLGGTLNELGRNAMQGLEKALNQ